MNRFGLVLVTLLSLVGCGQEVADDHAAPAQSASKDALAPQGRLHLILLSGQSNMSRMIWADEGTGAYLLDKKFQPALDKAFPNDEFVIAPVAKGGRPISHWVPNGALYQQLVQTARQRLNGRTPSTITFIWRQGEEDHNSDALTRAYEDNLRMLYAQLKRDFGTNEINWVIGRLNDARIRMDPNWAQHDNWMTIRRIEQKVAESTPRADWVDCDSFNDDNNEDIHGAPSDYLRQQTAFAEKTIALIHANP